MSGDTTLILLSQDRSENTQISTEYLVAKYLWNFHENIILGALKLKLKPHKMIPIRRRVIRITEL